MRCTRARQWMTAAADGELGGRRKRRLERHVATCTACGAEQARTVRLLAALAALPTAASVSARLEQGTLRRVRLLAADEGEHRARRGWWLLGVPAAALAAVTALLLVVSLGRQAESPSLVPPRRVARAPQPATAPEAAAERRAPATPTAVARTGSRPVPPAEPPPDLAAAPDLFVDMPILRNLEKLRHYEDIRTTTLDDHTAPGADGERSNG